MLAARHLVLFQPGSGIVSASPAMGEARSAAFRRAFSFPCIKKARANSCSHKHDGEPHRDHGVQAGNGNAQVKIGGHIREVYRSAVQSISRFKYITRDPRIIRAALKLRQEM